MPDLIVGVLIAAAIALYLLWLLLTIIWQVLADLVANLWNGMTGETARRKERQEVARKKEEERQEEARKEEEERQQRQRERRRERQQAEARERKQFRTENREVFAGISVLLSTCTAPAAEIMCAARAIEGTDIEMNPKAVVWMDVGFILVSFSKTGSLGDAYIKRLWSEVTRTIKPPELDGIAPPLSVVKNRGVKQLGMILFLAEYDKQQGTTLSSKAASTYLSIVSAVSDHCEGSLAAKIVADKYIELLRPYIYEDGRDRYAGRSTSSAGSQSSRKPVCQKCIKDFELLGLSVGASKDEVGQKRRDCADVLHPDKLGGKSERARNAAEQQLKVINAACDRLLLCCARSTS
jgi:hypothetical protein